MLNKKSTRSIVTGKRPADETTGAETTVSGRIVSEAVEASEAMPQQPEKVSTSNKPGLEERLKIGKNRWIWLAGAIGLVVVAVCLFVMMSLSRTDIEDGMSIIAVQADEALIDYVKPGDVVRIYDTHGQIIQALQYVQVYRATEFKQLLLVVDGVQASSLATYDISPKMVVVCHRDREMASQMLEMQAQINNPKITLSIPESIVLEPEATMELEVDTSVEPVEASVPEVQWITSDSDVVEVENGVITARGVGTATVTAICGNAEAQCNITVEVPLTGITLEQSKVALLVDETVSLSAAPQPENTTSFEVVWSSSDSGVATVDENGTVTAVAPGKATITATSGTYKASCKVVVGVHAEVAVLDKTSLTLEVSQTEKISGTAYPVEAIDPVSYESSDPEIATVSEDGTVTAIAPGACSIVFRCGEAETSCAVIVSDPAV